MNPSIFAQLFSEQETCSSERRQLSAWLMASIRADRLSAVLAGRLALNNFPGLHHGNQVLLGEDPVLESQTTMGQLVAIELVGVLTHLPLSNSRREWLRLLCRASLFG